MEVIKSFFDKYFFGISLPSINFVDVIEMIIIAFAIYHIIMWVKNTRAWMLAKGILVLLLFSVIAIILKMDVILWIFKNAISVGIIALIIVFQPELRSALEQLGRKKVISGLFTSSDHSGESGISDNTINAIARACTEMSRVKTGALIVIEKDIMLKEIERSGINIDAEVSSQLLINIFEHNTPLHDGAVIIRDNRIVAATCYLPMSDNLALSKELGTRHRAAIGVSEVSDSLTVIVSEETGAISLAQNGAITRNIDAETIRRRIYELTGKNEDSSSRRTFWKKKNKEVGDSDEE